MQTSIVSQVEPQHAIAQPSPEVNSGRVVSEYRSQMMRVPFLPRELKEYYDDLQKDYRAVLKFCVEWSGRGYYVWSEDNPEPTIHQPEVSLKLRATKPLVAQLVDILAGGGNYATNCYGLFYDAYNANEKPKKGGRLHKLVQCLTLLDDVKFAKEVKAVNQLTPEDWADYRRRAKAGETINNLWEEVSQRVGNPNEAIRLVVQVKALNLLPRVRRPHDYNYCTALLDMVVSSFSSWIECSKLHEATRISLQEKVNRTREDNPPLFDALRQFAAVLESLQYRASKKVLRQCRELIDEGKQDPFFERFCVELRKYQPLLDCKWQALWAAYAGLKSMWKLSGMQLFVSLPRGTNDYQVPFGLTGKGISFNLSIHQADTGSVPACGALTVAVKGHQPFTCMRSHYFSDLTIAPKDNNCFRIRFRHRVKTPKKEVYSQFYNAEICEVKLQRRANGHFYLYLPYKLSFSPHTFVAESFFRSASPTPETIAKLPIEMRVAAFDLNQATPLTCCRAVLYKDFFDGSVPALDYGSGELLELPHILAGDTGLSDSLLQLYRILKGTKRNKNGGLIEVIRQYKAALKQAVAGKTSKEDIKLARSNIQLSEEAELWLNEQVGNRPCGDYRHQIQIVLRDCNRRRRHLVFLARKNGHNNLAESIRLLQVLDVTRSISTSFRNLHIFEKEKQVYYRKMNDARANFREFVSKQYAAQIARASEGCSAVFIEDLDFEFDADNMGNSNSISRLMAAGQLKKAIENALHKQGIGCVFVAPANTSCTDPITGCLAGRDKEYSKRTLVVLRNGTLGRMDADITAALNILLVGVQHSIMPRRFFVKGGEIPLSGETEGKRLKRFLKERGLSRAYFTLNEREELCVTKRKKQSNKQIPYTGYVYLNVSQETGEMLCVSMEQHDKQKAALKVLALSNGHSPEVGVMLAAGQQYKAFSAR